MSDLDVLRDLVRQLPRPAYDELVTVARRRRRRVVLSAAVAATVAVVALGTAGDAMFTTQRQPLPAEQPSPALTESPRSDRPWTPERIRDEGSSIEDVVLTTDSGLSARLYQVCPSSPCSGEHGTDDAMRAAVEVTQGGRSAVFGMRFSRNPWVRVFDEETVLALDDVDPTPKVEVRYRLLRADGTSVPLELVQDPAPPAEGPGVFVNDFSGWSIGMSGTDDLYVVDEEARTVRPVDEPAAVRYWGPNTDEFLWGATDDCRVVWATDGAFQVRRLDCSDSVSFTLLNADFPEGWLRPGRMVVVEEFGEGRTAAHVSLDRGATWQRILFYDEADYARRLRQLG